MKSFRYLVPLLALAAVAAAFAAHAASHPPLRRIEAKRVCMINERAMEKDQIPVQVDGKTYFGCCEMCKKALTTDASKRSATDPISGKSVDKAMAVIAADAEGNVFYFENEQNLAKYNRASKR